MDWIVIIVCETLQSTKSLKEKVKVAASSQHIKLQDIMFIK